MILINIKMQIRPEKMDEWLRWPTPTPRTSTPRTAACSSSSPGVLPTTTSSSASRLQGCRGGATHVKQPYVKKFFDTAPDLVATQPQIIYIDTPHDGFGPMGEIQPR